MEKTIEFPPDGDNSGSAPASASEGTSSSINADQFDEVNEKLDAIMRALGVER